MKLSAKKSRLSISSDPYGMQIPIVRMHVRSWAAVIEQRHGYSFAVSWVCVLGLV